MQIFKYNSLESSTYINMIDSDSCAILDTEVWSRFNLQSYTSLIATKKTVKNPFAHHTSDNYFRRFFWSRGLWFFSCVLFLVPA